MKQYKLYKPYREELSLKLYSYPDMPQKGKTLVYFVAITPLGIFYNYEVFDDWNENQVKNKPIIHPNPC